MSRNTSCAPAVSMEWLCTPDIPDTSRRNRSSNTHVQVRIQVMGAKKTVIDKTSVVKCTFCRPPTPLTLRNHAHHLQEDIWSAYCDAITEKAVISEQARLKQTAPACASASEDPVEQAINHARTLTLPQCPKCGHVIPDFDACAAIKCGALCISQEGLQGCGALLCAWCLRICQPHDHSMHVAWCELNPRQGQAFPDSMDVWHAVQSRQARMRVLKFLATLPKGVTTEVRRAVAREFPQLGFKENDGHAAEDVVGSVADRPQLRPQPPPPPRHFLDNIEMLLDMGVAFSRARAQQVLEATHNDLASAIDLLLASAS